MDSSTLSAAASSQPTPPVYHWIMTVQLLSGIIETHDGLHTPDSPTTTRSAVFNAIVDAVKARYGAKNIAVLFYNLALNDMQGSVAS